MSEIVTAFSDGILRIELNRPEKKNALTASMYTRLADILRAGDEAAAVRVVLLHGAGDSFSAGNDIADFLKPQAVQRLARSAGPSALCRTWVASRCAPSSTAMGSEGVFIGGCTRVGVVNANGRTAAGSSS